ncbi:MAG: adenosylcobinamide-GDP ribazoletransferase [Bradyrhizobium sp.]|uniref:adenosylcobinamide-GDP ribazoletransferase n=1 Tax=Bradyrhizobium sp. TaxID=376 RepID=UPI001DE14004|nr:adenosylcobinamide-GDP ribazoletransferase [Bradyrhizobium sp.]MBV9566474.1 adenosylcobinamide-GDP ribazoletransferase [Bradyrhizobium sp.]
MDAYLETAQRVLTELRLGIALCTRLPVGPMKPADDGDVARASWTFPVAGLLIALIGAAVYWLAARLRIPTEPAAALLLVVIVLLTGAMHEDGLADTADGFGGGTTREQKLEIMRDSRLGAYGGSALALSFLVRWSALIALSEPRYVTIALVLAHVGARALLPPFMRYVPAARQEGLSSSAGTPPARSAAIAMGLGAVCLLLGFGLGGTIVALIVLGLITLGLAAFARRQIGGQTGDVLGALEQVAETAILLIATARF